MRRFFIDYENIASCGMKGIGKLDENNAVYLFYTANADKLDFELHGELTRFPGIVEFFRVETGNNSLDFQMSSFLGSIINQSKKDSFFIVSKDKGFAPVVKFWKSRSIEISQVNNMMLECDSTMQKKLQEALPEYKADVEDIAEIINKYKSKQGINTALLKKYGSEKTGVIYKAIKPYIKDKSGS